VGEGTLEEHSRHLVSCPGGFELRFSGCVADPFEESWIRPVEVDPIHEVFQLGHIDNFLLILLLFYLVEKICYLPSHFLLIVALEDQVERLCHARVLQVRLASLEGTLLADANICMKGQRETAPLC